MRIDSEIKNTRSKMNYNQNRKISQIIVGIDIAKDKHVARAQDDRGYEFGKRLIFDIAYTVFNNY